MNADDDGARPAQQRPFNEFGLRNIADTSLRISDVPQADSTDWSTIARFALTYDAYENLGSFERVAVIANNSLRHWRATGQLPESLTNMRVCIFFEQKRRWRHFGEQPDKEAMVYIAATLAALRGRLTTTDVH